MADATDWTKLRDAAYRITCITRTANFCESDDEVVAWGLLGIIPADPNKAADAEWLKERGWVDSDTGTMLEFTDMIYFRDGGDFSVGGRFHSGLTRMTVALFEAAAMEAMKHGE